MISRGLSNVIEVTIYNIEDFTVNIVLSVGRRGFCVAGSNARYSARSLERELC